MGQDKKERVNSRRDFLRYSATGGALALASPALIIRAESSAPSNMASSKGAFELEEVTIAELQAGMKSGIEVMP